MIHLNDTALKCSNLLISTQVSIMLAVLTGFLMFYLAQSATFQRSPLKSSEMSFYSIFHVRSSIECLTFCTQNYHCTGVEISGKLCGLHDKLLLAEEFKPALSSLLYKKSKYKIHGSYYLA